MKFLTASTMRALMFSYYFPPQYSGAAKQALSLAKHLRGHGHHVEFVTVRWQGLKEYEEVEGFPVWRIEEGRGGRHKELRLWGNLIRFVLKRRRDFDILHSHGAYYTNSIVGPLARLLGWKSIVKASLADNDLHGLKTSLAGHIHHAFLGKVDAYVAISRDLEKEFHAAGFPPHKVLYLPNGVDTNRFRPAKVGEGTGLRKELGLPTDRPVALTVGVFDQRKNIGWLMEQWVKNNAFGTGALLLAVGPQSREDSNGTFIRSLQKLADENPRLLRLMTYVEDIENCYRAASMFILPSNSEGMPNVILEAMASGLPCVATRVSGIQELVREGENGHIYAPNDVAGLRDAVNAVSADADSAMGQKARQFIEQRFSLANLAEQYESLYETLISSEVELSNA